METMMQYHFPSLDSLGCIKINPTPASCMSVKECAKAKQEPDMKATYISTNVNAVDSQDANARQYLGGRAEMVFYAKDHDLRKTFGLEDDEYPYDPKDMVKRIQDGKFVLEEGKHGSSRILWRDPELKEDKEGYKAAKEKMEVGYTKVTDDIMVLYPDQGLESLRTFEAETFH